MNYRTARWRPPEMWDVAADPYRDTRAAAALMMCRLVAVLSGRPIATDPLVYINDSGRCVMVPVPRGRTRVDASR